MNGAFVRDFQQPMTLLIRQLANQFNVSFNVVGEVRLPHLSRARIGKRLLALVVVGTYNMGFVMAGGKTRKRGSREEIGVSGAGAHHRHSVPD